MRARAKGGFMPIKEKIRTIPDHPKKGIMFRDITTLIKDPVGFRLVIDNFTQRYIKGDIDFDIIVGIESRGFIIGGALAYTLGKGLSRSARRASCRQRPSVMSMNSNTARTPSKCIRTRSRKAPECWLLTI